MVFQCYGVSPCHGVSRFNGVMVLSWILQTTQLLVTILFMMNMSQRLGVDLAKAKCLLGTTRPTAVNLVWALEKVVNILNSIVVISFKKVSGSLSNPS